MTEDTENAGLTPEELEAERGEPLPNREAMSIVPVSGDPGEWAIAPPPMQDDPALASDDFPVEPAV